MQMEDVDASTTSTPAVPNRPSGPKSFGREFIISTFRGTDTSGTTQLSSLRTSKPDVPYERRAVRLDDLQDLIERRAAFLQGSVPGHLTADVKSVDVGHLPPSGRSSQAMVKVTVTTETEHHLYRRDRVSVAFPRDYEGPLSKLFKHEPLEVEDVPSPNSFVVSAPLQHCGFLPGISEALGHATGHLSKGLDATLHGVMAVPERLSNTASSAHGAAQNFGRMLSAGFSKDLDSVDVRTDTSPTVRPASRVNTRDLSGDGSLKELSRALTADTPDEMEEGASCESSVASEHAPPQQVAKERPLGFAAWSRYMMRQWCCGAGRCCGRAITPPKAHVFSPEQLCTNPAPRGTMLAELNMHKLAPEVVVPLTTVEERVVTLETDRDVDAMFEAVSLFDREANNLVLNKDVNLSSGVRLSEGLTIHGRLVENGHVRRSYWSAAGDRAAQWWRTGGRHGRQQLSPEHAPEGFAENSTFASKEDIFVGAVLVLRRGTSYAEVCHGGLQTVDFISHNWSEPSLDFLSALRAARVRAAWICTLAVNQHCVPDLAAKMEECPFYQALKSLEQNGGRVVMVLDEAASTLTRIWPVFEVWCAARLRLRFQMFVRDSELRLSSTTPEAMNAARRIDELNLREAGCSVQADKDTIIEMIDNSAKGMAGVSWQVKRMLSVGAMVFNASLLTETSSMIFLCPWLVLFVRGWLETSFGMQDAYATDVAWVFAATVVLWQLRHWFFWLRNARLQTVSFFRTVARGNVWDRLGISMLVLEGFLLLAICIIWVHDGFFRHMTVNTFLGHLLCDKVSDELCVFWTLFLLVKSLPWTCAFVFDVLRMQKWSIENYRAAAPRIGFIVSVGAVCVVLWYHRGPYTGSEPGCEAWLKNPGDPSNAFKFRRPILAGMAAWAASTCGDAIAAVWRLWRDHRRVCLATSMLLLCCAVALSVALAVKGLLDDPLKNFDSTMAIVGILIWLVAASAWHHRKLLRRTRRCLKEKQGPQDLLEAVLGNESFSCETFEPSFLLGSDIPSTSRLERSVGPR